MSTVKLNSKVRNVPYANTSLGVTQQVREEVSDQVKLNGTLIPVIIERIHEIYQVPAPIVISMQDHIQMMFPGTKITWDVV